MTRPSKLLFLAVAAAVLFILVLAFKTPRPETIPMAQLRLKGYETNSSQVKVAVFELKNPGPRAVEYLMHHEIAGKVQNIAAFGTLGGHSTNLVHLPLSDRPTRLMVNCSPRDTLRDLGHEILGLVGKRPSTSPEYSLFSDDLTK